MTTPSKTEQQQEALQRARERGHGTPDNVHPPVDDATTPNDLPADGPPPEVVSQDAPVPTKPLRFTDSKRNAIVSRFREQRSTEADEDVAEILAFAHNGIPPELLPKPAKAAEPEPEEPAEDDTPPADAPVKRTKVIVRGREMELSDEELLAHAQKSLAADDYLGEAKGKLDEVNALLRDTRTRAAPASTSPHTPAPQAGERTDQPTDTPAEHPARKPMSKVVELIQFGDPEEAAAELDRTIDERAAQRSGQALQRERLRNETVRSHRFLQEFATEHADLAQDEFASAAMEKRLFQLQREDLVKLAKSFGKDESVVPTSPQGIAQWHLYYRTEGHPVRDVPSLLRQTKDDFVTWRDKGKPAKEEPTPKQAAPRVEVVVDRSARRQAIPQQPTRTSSPKPDAVVAPPAQRDRSSIVQQMQRARAKTRGVVLGAP